MEYLFYYIPPAPNKILSEYEQGKVNFNDNTTFFCSKKNLTRHIQWQHTGTINLNYLNY